MPRRLNKPRTVHPATPSFAASQSVTRHQHLTSAALCTSKAAAAHAPAAFNLHSRAICSGLVQRAVSPAGGTGRPAFSRGILGRRPMKPFAVTSPNPHIPGDTDGVFSPDGRWIAFRRTVGDSVEDLYIAPMPAIHSPIPEAKRITSDNRSIGGHAWTPDRRAIVLASERASGSYGLWSVPLSGGKMTRLTQAGIVAVRPAISRRGDRLAYESVVNDSNIWQLDLEARTAPKLVIASTMIDTSPQISPDGTQRRLSEQPHGQQ